MSRIFWVIFIVIILFAMALASLLQGAVYSVQDLGTMGQDSSYAHGLSEAGHVTGRAVTDGVRTYFRTEPGGSATDIPVTTFPYQAADTSNDTMAVNSNGTVLLNRSKDGISHVFVWQSGSPTEISDPSAWTYARDINDAGLIVGSYEASFNGSYHAFWYDPATGVRNNVPGSGTYSAGFRINANGLILGQYDSQGDYLHGFLYDTRTQSFRDIGLLGGYTNSHGTRLSAMPKGLNRLGEVVSDGWDQTTGYQHATFWSNQFGTLDMGTLGGDFSFAYGINDWGVAVGVSKLSQGNTLHGYVWTRDGGMQDLNSLLLPGADWTIVDVCGINNAGQIAGTALGSDGISHAVLLNPVPEPPTGPMALIAIFFAILGRLWYKRR